MASTRTRSQQRPPSVDEALREVLKLLPQIVGGVKRVGGPPPQVLRDVFVSASLGPRHIPALAVIALDGPLSVSALAAKLEIPLTSASLMVGELSRTGLVERREDEADRRRTIVSVAPQYREPIEGWLAERSLPVRRALAALAPGDRAAFIEGLRALEAELRTAAREGTGC